MALVELLYRSNITVTATLLTFAGALRHRTQVDVVFVECVYWRWRDVIRRAGVTCCHDSGSLLSVCVDSWFILGAMIVHAPQVCSLTQPQSPISLTRARWGCKPSTTNTPQSHLRSCCYTECADIQNNSTNGPSHVILREWNNLWTVRCGY